MRTVSRLIVAIVVLIAMLVPLAATANPFPEIPPGYVIGRMGYTLAAKDTLSLTPTNPANGTTWLGPLDIYVATPGKKSYEVIKNCLFDGIMLTEDAPLRYKATFADGTTSGTIPVLVDTTQAARGTGAFTVHYACRATILKPISSIQLWTDPATKTNGDTLWYATLVRRP